MRLCLCTGQPRSDHALVVMTLKESYYRVRFHFILHSKVKVEGLAPLVKVKQLPIG